VVFKTNKGGIGILLFYKTSGAGIKLDESAGILLQLSSALGFYVWPLSLKPPKTGESKYLGEIQPHQNHLTRKKKRVKWPPSPQPDPFSDRSPPAAPPLESPPAPSLLAHHFGRRLIIFSLSASSGNLVFSKIPRFCSNFVQQFGFYFINSTLLCRNHNGKVGMGITEIAFLGFVGAPPS